VNTIGYEARKHFMNIRKEYLKDEINKRAMNSKNKNIRDMHRGLSEFKKGYQPRNSLVKDENDLLAGPHNILNTWKNYYLQYINRNYFVFLGSYSETFSSK
jgi:hypothetical protein